LRENIHKFNSKTITFQGQLIVIKGDFKKNEAKCQIQLRQSIFIVIICYYVEVHEKTRGEYIRNT